MVHEIIHPRTLLSNKTAGLTQLSGISAEMENIIRKVQIIFIKPYTVVKLEKRSFPGATVLTI